MKNVVYSCCTKMAEKKIILNGLDLQTNEMVQFRLPASIVVKIQELMNKPTTKFQKFILWIEKLFGQTRHKVVTITANGKTYEVKSTN